MKISTCILFGAVAASFSAAADKTEEKINYADHILPILENKCLNCHNPDEAKGGLDLSTYGAMLNGGSGGKVIETEDPAGSRLYSLMAHTEEPYMPPRKPKAPDEELAVIAKWINGGILETSNSKARKSDKPKMDMTLITSAGKPEGPAAMPEHVILQPEVVTARPTSVPALAHSPWAPIVAIAGQKQVILYHSEDFDVLGILPYPEGFPQSLSFSSSGSLLQAGGGRGGKAGNVVAWDVKTGERVFEVGREFDIVLGSDISPDHRRVVMGGPGKIFKIWDTVSGEQVAAVKKHPDWMLTADYSPDGVLLATGGRNSGLYIWEGETGLEFYTLKGHTKAVTNVGWRPDSNILGSISEDGQAMLWEMNEGKQIKKWTAHAGGGLAIDFSADGQMIATAGRDKTVKLWKVDGAALRTIKASDDIVMSVVFTHDSKRVISGDYHGVIKVWNVSDGKQLGTLDANPPTIDKQIEYAEKRLTELSSKIPTLEKSVASVRAEAAKVKAKLSEVSKVAGELSSKKATMDKTLAGLGGKVKALNDEKEKARGMLTQNTSLMQQRAAERVKAEKALQAAQTQGETLKQSVAKLSGELRKVAEQANALKKIADSPVFADANKQKAYVTAKNGFTTALAAKQSADNTAASLQKQVSELNAGLAVQKKALAQIAAASSQAKAARDKAKEQFDASVYKRQETDNALKAAGETPPPELVKARDDATKAQISAQNLFNKAEDTYTSAAARMKIQEGMVAKAENAHKDAAAKLAAAQNDQKAKTIAWQKADALLKPLNAEGAAKVKEIDKANAELPGKIAAYQKIDGELKKHQTTMSQLASSINQLAAKLKSAIAAENSARGGMEDANSTLVAKSKALSETGSKLQVTKAELDKINKALDDAQKQKDAQAKALAAITAKESQAKSTIELAKADLEQSQFLAQKFKAAAINFEAKVESEELDDMAVDLDDMLNDETEAKQEAKEATQARLEAEKTLAEAKKTVVDGKQKLKEKTSSVLERAIALIATRASVGLREEVVDVTEKPAELAAKEPATPETKALAEDMPPEILPGEITEEIEVVEVVSNTLAAKTPEELSAEIQMIQKRLDELTNSISQAYIEASETSKTVVAASTVAAKTPPVIAERTKIEKAKTEMVKSIEEERKNQEATVEQQRKLIEELKKKYLETFPERKP